jgi:hypothetical protein
LDCDKKLSGGYGVFSSPNYPSNYPSSADCMWTIGKGMAFDEVLLLFESFNVEDGNSGICRLLKITIIPYLIRKLPPV